MRKYDKESDYRNLTGLTAKFVSALAITFTLFQLYTAIFGVLDAMIQRSIHVSFGFALIFLLYPARKKWSRNKIHPIDLLFAIIGAAIPLYIVVSYQELVLRAGTVTTNDYIIGILGVLFVLEAARRIVGWPIVTVAALFLAYAIFGRYIPGQLAHRGVDLESLVYHLFFTTEGIFGIPIGVSSTFIFLFILFGAFLEKTGMGQFFIDIANSIAGWASGGPAKVAVLSSGLMGTISGSSVANVVGTGSFTIPMMKKLGYKPEFAGAVEATASTGGQLMPPIMGAAAFLMAEFTSIPYVTIIGAALIPAILYYFGVWTGIHLEAKKLGLKGLKREDLPKIKEIMLERGHLFLPLAAIVYLLVTGYTPMRAALIAIVLSILVSAVKRSTRISFLDIIKGLEQGARGVLGVLAATACAGIIIGVVTKTGLGLKLGSSLVDLAGGKLILTLFFTMVTSIILGMGVPTTANYVITSTIAAPALLLLDVPVLAAHMFVFYFGIIADVTPPVALAAFAGSGIAKSNPMKTAFEASKLAIAAYLVPYIFVLSPALLLIDVNLAEIIGIVITSLIGIVAVGSAVAGYLVTHEAWYERIIFFLSGVMLIQPGIYTDIIGISIITIGYILQKRKAAKLNPQT
ncbi:MAG: C4-dicarboxylate ABC transporter [Clostridiaceae bacterium BRH_c20a]|nr:MAG: C4-dicarboxylate ABC transporter [Clostridiaceae bacterium BRH_c20a]